MPTPILLTGGTGTLGRVIVPRLRDTGCYLRVLSRNVHQSTETIEYVTGDLATDQGIRPAVEGVDVIVHMAGGPKGDDEATRNLVRAAAAARVRHIVYISVIGADRVPLGYFRAKHGAEQAVADSGVPWTTLRAAQFHDLILTMLQAMVKLPVIPVPGGVRLQPVAPDDVAARLVELALAPPAGLVPDLAGPTTYGLGELIHGYLRASGKRRATMPVRMPGKVGRAYRAGKNLAPAGAVRGAGTWEDFVAERLSTA
jgi:uncharacterized protein YbjT (DUF2867 family)